MLPKAHRLSKKEFGLVLEKGKRARLRFLFVYTLDNRDKTPNKVGVSIPKKLVKTAVKRHLYKRAIFKAYGATGRLFQGLSIVCIPHTLGSSEDYIKDISSYEKMG